MKNELERHEIRVAEEDEIPPEAERMIRRRKEKERVAVEAKLVPAEATPTVPYLNY